MYMSDWIERLDKFMKVSKHVILSMGEGLSAKIAELNAKEEYKVCIRCCIWRMFLRLKKIV